MPMMSSYVVVESNLIPNLFPFLFKPIRVKNLFNMNHTYSLENKKEKQRPEKPIGEKALLVGIERADETRDQALDSLRELALLAYTAGARVVDETFQKLKRITPSYFVGEGKAKEIAGIVKAKDIDVILIDSDLSAGQQGNLEALCEAKVIDRTGLILDIFAQRAQSRAGKLQVELAQLNYLLPRLKGHGVFMSRLGGGIGTRGPGETKLEYDRRKIRDRIATLKKELLLLENSRQLYRSKRQGVPVPVVAIVGYTNAGKSTLLNTLTQAQVLAEDKVFATLDPTTRQLLLPNHQKVLMTDTVGFIKKLPVQLVEAFKATLEEVVEADLLLHMIDVSHPDFEQQAQEVLKVLEQLGVYQKPILHVYNKIDLLPANHHLFLRHKRLHPFCMISAEKEQNLEALFTNIQTLLSNFVETVDLKLPLEDQKTLSLIYANGLVIEKKYLKNSVRIKAQVSHRIANQLKKKYSG
ncbi:MAG: GTPase HflX [Deltaproteobacteria bacterium]|nr:GTPase HflX [Deltaproteobacteria bacterium]